MLDIDKGGQAAALLRLRDHREGECCFSRSFRAVNFNHSAPRKSAYAERAINQNISGRDNVDINDLLVPETHDGAFAVVFRDLLNGKIKILISRGGYFVFAGFLCGLGGHIFED